MISSFKLYWWQGWLSFLIQAIDSSRIQHVPTSPNGSSAICSSQNYFFREVPCSYYWIATGYCISLYIMEIKLGTASAIQRYFYLCSCMAISCYEAWLVSLCRSQTMYLSMGSSPTENWIYPLVNIQKTMENHHFSWENSLFLWPCSMSLFVCRSQARYYLRFSRSKTWDLGPAEINWLL